MSFHMCASQSVSSVSVRTLYASVVRKGPAFSATGRGNGAGACANRHGPVVCVQTDPLPERYENPAFPTKVV